jgi:hypothetical protein
MQKAKKVVTALPQHQIVRKSQSPWHQLTPYGFHLTRARMIGLTRSMKSLEARNCSAISARNSIDFGSKPFWVWGRAASLLPLSY